MSTSKGVRAKLYIGGREVGFVTGAKMAPDGVGVGVKVIGPAPSGLFGQPTGWDGAAADGKVIGSLREFCGRLQMLQAFKPADAHRAFHVSVDGGTIERAEPFRQWLNDRNAMLVRRYGSVIPRKLRRASMKALRREWLGFLEGCKASISKSLRERDGREIPIVELGINGLVHERDAQGCVTKMDMRSVAVLPPRGGG